MAKATTKDTAAPVIDRDRMAQVVARIEELHRTHFTDLVHQLKTEEGMKLNRRKNPCECRMHGITATSTAGANGAVTNWANAARRLMLRGDAT